VNHPAITPELQRLINEPLNEPPARACEHWKELAKVLQQLDRAREQQGQNETEAARLGQELVVPVCLAGFQIDAV
jgi:hypothetical protein